jgi:hypothetical protein
MDLDGKITVRDSRRHRGHCKLWVAFFDWVRDVLICQQALQLSGRNLMHEQLGGLRK